MRVLSWATILGCGLVFAFGVEMAEAQEGPSRSNVPPTTSLDSALQVGVRAWAAQDTSRALRHLEWAFEGAPARKDSSGRSVAYWLGTVYEAQGRTDRALEVWEEGITANPDGGDSVDVALADAFLQALEREDVEGSAKAATQAYRSVLSRVGASPQRSTDSVFKRHIAQLAPVLAVDTVRVLVQGTLEEPGGTWEFRSDAGDRLLRWWRQRDPLPATRRNERMLEHLRRVAYARQEFACEEEACQPAGWDDRGDVHVRFGPPARRESVTYNDMDFNLDVFRFGVPVSRHDFPYNELWTYPHIDQSGKYIFVEKNGICRIATTNDLLPRQLRVGYGGRTDRALNKAVSALASLRHIYEKLSLHHIGYSQRYSEIQNYASWQEEQAALVEMGAYSSSRTRTVGSGVGQKRSVGPGPGSNTQYPNEFVSDHLHESKVRDRRVAKKRENRMPSAYSRIGENVESLPVAIRAARFLSETGSTEVRLAWSHPSNASSLSEETKRLLVNRGIGPVDSLLVRFTGVQYDEEYRRQATSALQYRVRQMSGGKQGRLEVHTLTTRTASDSFHLQLQWDQSIAFPRGTLQFQRGPLVKRTVKRVDFLSSLQSEGEKLIMSDLMPVQMKEGQAPVKRSLTPYPFRSLPEGERMLSLYFELYNLSLGEQERSKYTIEYTVERPKESGGFFKRLFGGEERTETRTELTYEGESRRAEEFIQLDLGEWEEGAAGPVTVTVRVTDEITGRQAQRTVSFDTEDT